jgi:hypothetical protein
MQAPPAPADAALLGSACHASRTAGHASRATRLPGVCSSADACNAHMHRCLQDRCLQCTDAVADACNADAQMQMQCNAQMQMQMPAQMQMRMRCIQMHTDADACTAAMPARMRCLHGCLHGCDAYRCRFLHRCLQCTDAQMPAMHTHYSIEHTLLRGPLHDGSQASHLIAAWSALRTGAAHR